jgi:DNA-directed RNA polymerase specialized sigma subunit
MKQSSLPTPIFRYIEYCLFHYRQMEEDYTDYLREYHKSLEEVMFSSGRSMGVSVQGGGITDNTGNKAIRLLGLPPPVILLTLDRTIQSIRHAVERMTDEERDIYSMRYLQGVHYRGILKRMHISKSKYFRLRSGMVGRVADAMGLCRCGKSWEKVGNFASTFAEKGAYNSNV